MISSSQTGPHAVLLDIEGTVTPISFVHEILFPFAQAQVREFLSVNRNSRDVQQDLASLHEEYAIDLKDGRQPPPLHDGDSIVEYLNWLIDLDRKSPGLKSLQGKIWRQGYVDGSLRAPVFPDVVAAIESWQSGGTSINIFSSGSVLAQKLLFEHTDAGDLTKYIYLYFDTGVGKKGEEQSYHRIASSLSLPTNQILFVSYVVSELEAARRAEMQAVLCVRPGNPTQPDSDFQQINSFAEFF